MAHIYNMSVRDIRDILHADTADVPGEDDNLYRHNNHSITQQQRTLFIGIGGTGVKVLDQIKHHLINNTYDFRDKIAFLALDTDHYELLRTKYLTNQEMILLSDNPATARTICNISSNRPDYVKSWINPDFFVCFDNHGANGFRQSAIAKLYMQMHSGIHVDVFLKNHIFQAVQQLCPTFHKSTSVYLISSFGGSTGSAIFNDVAMITKDALGDSCEINGVILLPDMFDQYKLNVSSLNHFYAQGYAALKELDYYVGLEQRNGYTDTHQPTYYGSQIYGSNNPLYKHIFLYNATHSDSSLFFKKSTSIDIMAETLINILNAQTTSDLIDEPNRFSMALFDHIKLYKEKLFMDALDSSGKEKPGYYLDANFSYSSFGLASVSIPEDIGISYLISQTLNLMFADNTCPDTCTNSISRTVSNPVSDAIGKPSIPESEAMAVIQSLVDNITGSSFNYTGLTNMIKTETMFSIPSGINVSSLMTKDQVILNNHQVLAPMINYPIKKTNAIQSVDAYISSMFADFRFRALAFIKEYGPQAFVDLYDGKGPDGMPFESVPGLKKAIALDKVLAPKPSASDGSLSQENNLKAEAERRIPIIRLHAANVSNYVRIYLNWQSSLLYEEICDYAFYAVNRLLLNPIDEFAQSCRDLATILKEVSDIYGNITKDFTKENFAASFGSYTDISLIRDNVSFNWLKYNLDSIIRKIDMINLREEIIDDFFGVNSKEWNIFFENHMITSNARQRMDSILTKYIKAANNGLDVSISLIEYMQHLFDTGTSHEQLSNRIASLLAKQCHPMFNRNPSLPPLCPDIHYVLFMPRSFFESDCGITFRKTLEAALSCNFNINVTLSLSDSSSRISLFAIDRFHALYQLKDIEKWEKSYNISNFRMIHRNESGIGDFDPQTGLEWKYYPTCRKNFDARQTKVASEHIDPNSLEYIFLTTEFDPMIQKALDYGILRREGDRQNGYYYRFYNISVPGWDLSPDTYTEEKHHHPKMHKALIDYLIRSNNNGLLVSKIVELSNNTIFTQPLFYQSDLDAEQVPLERAKRVIRANVKMYIELKKSVAIYETFASYQNERESTVNTGI